MIRLNAWEKVYDFKNDYERMAILNRLTISQGIVNVVGTMLYFDEKKYYVLKNRYVHNEHYTKIHRDDSGIIIDSTQWSNEEFLVLDYGTKVMMSKLIRESFSPWISASVLYQEIYLAKNVIVTEDFLR